MAKSASQPGSTPQNIPKLPRAVAVLLALGIAGLIGSLLVNVPPQDAISAHASAGEVKDATLRSAAFAAAKSLMPEKTGAPSVDVDYFPNRYVNQATKIEDMSPTF